MALIKRSEDDFYQKAIAILLGSDEADPTADPSDPTDASDQSESESESPDPDQSDTN